MKQNVLNWWKKNLALNTVSQKTYSSAIFQFSQHDYSSVLLIFLGTGLEELIVMWIDNVAWVSTPYSLVHTYECFGGASWIYLYRRSKDTVYPDVKAQYTPIGLHAPVTWRATILNCNI
jgi:hypothetical protein